MSETGFSSSILLELQEEAYGMLEKEEKEKNLSRKRSIKLLLYTQRTEDEVYDED